MSVAIIPDFVKYQIEWLTSHNDLEFEPVIEDAIVEMLKDTGKSFIDEQPDETSQTDHIADTGRKVEQTGETAQNVQNEDLISRKWLMECIEEGWVKFDTAKDCNRMMHLVRDIAPSVQPVLTCKGCRYDGYYKHMQCRNCLRKERDLYEPE